jgi:hypothetical protein
MRRTLLLALLAVLALPAAAHAAKVKIAPTASAVSDSGVATVEVANTTRNVLRGSAKVAVEGRTVSSRTVRLPKRSVSVVRLRFKQDAMSALRDAGGRATLKLKLRGKGGKAGAKRKLTLSLPTGDQPAPPAPGGDKGGGDPAPPASGRYLGRMGDEGAFDDFEATVSNGQIEITKPPFVPVACFEMGGYLRNALSLELFDVPGPWTIGTDAIIEKQGIAVNQLVSSGARTINYKLEKSSQTAGKVTGTLGMSFFESKYDIFSNTIYFVNCSGAQSFELVPA